MQNKYAPPLPRKKICSNPPSTREMSEGHRCPQRPPPSKQNIGPLALTGGLSFRMKYIDSPIPVIPSEYSNEEDSQIGGNSTTPSNICTPDLEKANNGKSILGNIGRGGTEWNKDKYKYKETEGESKGNHTNHSNQTTTVTKGDPEIPSSKNNLVSNTIENKAIEDMNAYLMHTFANANANNNNNNNKKVENMRENLRDPDPDPDPDPNPDPDPDHEKEKTRIYKRMGRVVLPSANRSPRENSHSRGKYTRSPYNGNGKPRGVGKANIELPQFINSCTPVTVGYRGVNLGSVVPGSEGTKQISNKYRNRSSVGRGFNTAGGGSGVFPISTLNPTPKRPRYPSRSKELGFNTYNNSGGISGIKIRILYIYIYIYRETST